MKKRIFSVLTALVVSLSILPTAFASEDTTTELNSYVTIVNENQTSINPYQKTSVGACYSYYDSNSTLKLVTKTAGVSTDSGRSPAYLVFKGVDFGDKGAASVTLEYAHKLERTGSINFYTATAVADGTYTSKTKIATLTSFSATGSYYADKTLTKTVDITADITGVHDVKVIFASGNNKCPNLVSFTFTEKPLTPDAELTVSTATTIPETVDTTNSVFNAVSQDNDGIHFEMDFGTGHTMDRLRANVSASGATGKIQLRDGSADGAVIAELDVSNVSTTDTYTEIFNRISADAKAFTGVHNLYVTYEGEGTVTIEKLWLEDGLSADIDVLNYTNYDATSSTLDSSNWFPMWVSNTRRYVKWSEVDFGETSVLRNLNIIMGTTTAYKGVTLNVFVDGIENGGTQIAEAVNRPEVNSWNDTDNYELVPVTADIKGFHDVYIYADATCPYLKSTKSLNVYSLDFTPETDNYNTYYNEYGDASTANHDLHHTVTFIPDETTPEKVGFLLALYNSNGRLVRADYKMTTPTEGVNAMTCTLDYTDLITNAGVTDTYTVKGIVWNALTLDPILTYEEVEVATINHTAS